MLKENACLYLSKTDNPVPTSNSESVLPKGEGFLSICPRRKELILQKQSEANKSLPEISHREVGSLKRVVTCSPSNLPQFSQPFVATEPQY